MNPEEIIQNIEKAYNDAIANLSLLDNERKKIIAQYIKDLENKKIEQIKQELYSINHNANNS
jgi:hypothetical protein